MDPNLVLLVQLAKETGLPGLVLLALVVGAIFELRVRPLWIRSLASRVAVERKLGVTPAEVEAIALELRGKAVPPSA